MTRGGGRVKAGSMIDKCPLLKSLISAYCQGPQHHSTHGIRSVLIDREGTKKLSKKVASNFTPTFETVTLLAELKIFP